MASLRLHGFLYDASMFFRLTVVRYAYQQGATAVLFKTAAVLPVFDLFHGAFRSVVLCFAKNQNTFSPFFILLPMASAAITAS